MPTDSPPPSSKTKILFWIGTALSTLVGAALVFSAVMKFTGAKEVIEGMAHLGWDKVSLICLGTVELTCVVLYLIPRTSVLGAILLTGYLGGATATHVRIPESFISPIILGVLVWLGIYLREKRLRAIIPWRR